MLSVPGQYLAALRPQHTLAAAQAAARRCPRADSRPDGASPGGKNVPYEPQLSLVPYCNTKVGGPARLQGGAGPGRQRLCLSVGT